VKGILSKSYTSEEPTPIQGRDIGATPIGHPIYLQARAGHQLDVVTSDLRAVGSNEPLTLILKTKANDPTGPIKDNSTVVLMPDAALAKNTSYVFSATVNNNGTPKNVNFTFATGAF
jgi:hypothetical protein